ncbi:glycosyltransferase [Pseudobutyrivibrio xylanivorans]|uniref:Glycosyl transferase family 4 n=1 Tax=Pseudobutyrivibrio xylanivorans TaxID=185007 RepID=A0A5P6VTX1_PSEXY|nr:glycosyltransferase [Pseudobutyrivibrio xylanivorans]QFJ56086.1 glycosyl transferase family 4 [Pseudobutyrivibrio xylanivorans]
MKKKALMVSTIVGFLATFEINDINILQGMGYEVHCACNCSKYADEKRIEKLKAQNIILHHIPFTRSPFSKENIRAYKELKQLMISEQFNLVHCHTPVGGVLGRMVAHKCRVPNILYTAHGFHFYDGAPLKNWIVFYPIEKHFSKYTDVLITINKEDYKRASEKFNAKKTVYIPGVGVDTEKFAICKIDKSVKRTELGVTDNDFLLLSVGELSRRKNQKIIIDALGEMKAEGTLGNIVYLAAGRGTQEEEFKLLIKEYDLEDNVKLLGFRSDIDELCEAVDCFVHPSIREGLGIAPLEAMAAGLPLISADVNGIRDYTEDGVSGCCINPSDVAAMVNAIKRMRDDMEFRNSCAANNSRTAKIFDIRNTNEIMEQVFKGGWSHLEYLAIRQQKRTELGLKADDFVIISVGELNDNKNHQVIIRTLKLIPNQIKYVLVGQGCLESKLKALTSDLKVENRVVFTGFRSDVKELLYAADCFAFPSKREGLGLAAIEAMSVGLPIVGHNVGGIRDFVVDGETGWLCKNNTHDEYKRLILEVMTNPIDTKQIELKAEGFAKSKTNTIMKEVYKFF